MAKHLKTRIVKLSPIGLRIAIWKTGARKNRRAIPVPIDEIPDDAWNEAAQTVLKEIRAETGIPDWLPKYLNGRDEFERRHHFCSHCISRSIFETLTRF
jgi:hypothetical protein